MALRAERRHRCISALGRGAVPQGRSGRLGENRSAPSRRRLQGARRFSRNCATTLAPAGQASLVGFGTGRPHPAEATGTFGRGRRGFCEMAQRPSRRVGTGGGTTRRKERHRSGRTWFSRNCANASTGAFSRNAQRPCEGLPGAASRRSGWVAVASRGAGGFSRNAQRPCESLPGAASRRSGWVAVASTAGRMAGSGSAMAARAAVRWAWFSPKRATTLGRVPEGMPLGQVPEGRPMQQSASWAAMGLVFPRWTRRAAHGWATVAASAGGRRPGSVAGHDGRTEMRGRAFREMRNDPRTRRPGGGGHASATLHPDVNPTCATTASSTNRQATARKMDLPLTPVTAPPCAPARTRSVVAA